MFKFIEVNESNSMDFHRLMQMYAKELDENQNRCTDEKILAKWTDGIIAKQYETGRCLKLCCADDKLIGFLYGKIDQPEDRGFKKAGYGYVMEFYVQPQYRRNGWGRVMLDHLEGYFRKNGAEKMYLTADPVTGKPFWQAVGFVSTGEISPENNLPIYEK